MESIRSRITDKLWDCWISHMAPFARGGGGGGSLRVLLAASLVLNAVLLFPIVLKNRITDEQTEEQGWKPSGSHPGVEKLPLLARTAAGDLGRVVQFSRARMAPGTIVEWHEHRTMRECFSVVAGGGVLELRRPDSDTGGGENAEKTNEELDLGDFSGLRGATCVPPERQHQIRASSKVGLELLYFGVDES
jgi:mannose-6-phosphate isomerase-like protein (cupin superfamily)